VLYTQKCEISSSRINHIVITNQPISIPQSGIITIYVNAFQAQTLGQSSQATFNVIWSYQDSSGIYIQRYNLNDGNPIGTTTNIPSEPRALRVGADEADQTIIAWQSNNNQQQTNTVSLQLLSQDLVKTQSYKQLNFQSGNYSLTGASVLAAIDRLVGQSPVAIDLINNNNQTKTLILDASSEKLLNISTVTENNDLTTLSPNSKVATISDPTALADIDTTNANSYPFADILGKISNIQINAPQCPTQATATSQIPEVQKVFEQYQNMLKEQPELISQVQSLLSNTKLTEALGKLGIKKETLYSIMNNANSIEDVISSFQKFNPFKDIDLSQIPDADISAQIAQARTFNQIMSDAIFGNANNLKHKFKTLENVGVGTPSDLLIQLLDLINNNASEEQIIEFFATTTKDVLAQLIRTLLTPIFDELQQQTKKRSFETQGFSGAEWFLIIGTVLVVGAIIGTLTCIALVKKNADKCFLAMLVAVIGLMLMVIGLVNLDSSKTPIPAPQTPPPSTPVSPTLLPSTLSPDFLSLCNRVSDHNFFAMEVQQSQESYRVIDNNNYISRTAYSIIEYKDYEILKSKAITLNDYNVLLIHSKILTSHNTTVTLQHLNASLLNISTNLILFEHPFIEHTKITKLDNEEYVIAISYTPFFGSNSNLILFQGNRTHPIYQVNTLPIKLYYNGAFDIIGNNNLFLSYASSPNTITLSQYFTLDDYYTIEIISICPDYQLDLRMTIINSDEFLVAWSHNNKKGIFVQTVTTQFDIDDRFYNIEASPLSFFISSNSEEFSLVWQEQKDTNIVNKVTNVRFFDYSSKTFKNKALSFNTTNTLYNYQMLNSDVVYLSYRSEQLFIEELWSANQTLIETSSTNLTNINQNISILIRESSQTDLVDQPFKFALSALSKTNSVTLAQSFIRWPNITLTTNIKDNMIPWEYTIPNNYSQNAISSFLLNTTFAYMDISKVNIVEGPNDQYNSISWALGIKNLWINPPKIIANFQSVFLNSCKANIKTANQSISTQHCWRQHPIDGVSPIIKGWGTNLGNMVHASRYIIDDNFPEGTWSSKLGFSYLITHEDDSLLDFAYNSSTGVALTSFVESIRYNYNITSISEHYNQILNYVYNTTHFSTAHLEIIQQSVSNISNVTRQQFDNAYYQWIDTCKQEKALSSYTYDCSNVETFHNLINLSSTIIPLLINKLVNPSNFLALVPYEAIQTNTSYHVPAFLENDYTIECEQSRAIKTVELWLHNEEHI
jgi:hypothetical protein